MGALHQAQLGWGSQSLLSGWAKSLLGGPGGRPTITVMLEYYQRDLVLDQERHLDRLLDQIWRSKMLEFYLILKPENL